MESQLANNSVSRDKEIKKCIPRYATHKILLVFQKRSLNNTQLFQCTFFLAVLLLIFIDFLPLLFLYIVLIVLTYDHHYHCKQLCNYISVLGISLSFYIPSTSYSFLVHNMPQTTLFLYIFVLLCISLYHMNATYCQKYVTFVKLHIKSSPSHFIFSRFCAQGCDEDRRPESRKVLSYRVWWKKKRICAMVERRRENQHRKSQRDTKLLCNKYTYSFFI